MADNQPRMTKWNLHIASVAGDMTSRHLDGTTPRIRAFAAHAFEYCAGKPLALWAVLLWSRADRVA
jgi:hypothetical protein